MQFRQLEYLVALAREEHFARAAAACWVSQPTLSDGIKALEAELGVAIVQRGRRYEGLTPEGERLVTFARRLLYERDELLLELHPEDGGLSGHLRIGAIPTSLPSLPLVSGPFLERYPSVDVTIRSLSSDEIERRLRDFELDAGVTYLDNEPLEHVRSLPLYEERHLLLVPEALVPDGAVAEWAGAAELPLCLLTPDMQNRRIVDELFRSAGVAAAPRVETNSVSALFAHVQTGSFASVVPQSWLYPHGAPAGTRALAFSSGDAPARIGLVWLDHEPVSLITRALVESVRHSELQAQLDAIVSEDPGTR